jgi:hypothetical protein
MSERFNRAWLDVTAEFADVIAASWHGHLHDDTFRLVHDLRNSSGTGTDTGTGTGTDTDTGTGTGTSTGAGTRTSTRTGAGGPGGPGRNHDPALQTVAAAVAVQLCVPSVTTWTEENPRLRLVQVNTSSSASLDVLGWRQYITHVDEDNARSFITWQLEYDLEELYQLPPAAARGKGGLGSDVALWEQVYARLAATPTLVAAATAIDATVAIGSRNKQTDWSAPGGPDLERLVGDGAGQQTELDRYLWHYHGRNASGLPCSKVAGCRAINLCRVKHADLPAFFACVSRGDVGI